MSDIINDKKIICDHKEVEKKIICEREEAASTKSKVEASVIKKVNKDSRAKGKKEVKETKCSICCESYSSSIRKKIECPKCNNATCKKCIETYLLGNDKDVPTCMHCNLEFSTAFMFENTSKVFFRDRFINKKAKKVFNEQKLLLPSTLITYNKKKENNQRQYQILQEISELQERIDSLSYEYNSLKNNFTVNEKLDDKIHRPCPVNDCKGYLSSAWKCGLCEVWVCPDCGNVKKERLQRNEHPHICNEDDKKTLLMLKKDTKPCPGCYKPIHKTEGCDQMFCVECHTAFSWITGKKVNGVIHNPHYYEFQRQQNGGNAPRVAGDNPCGINENELPPLYLIRTKLNGANVLRSLNRSNSSGLKLESIHMACAHNQEFVNIKVQNNININNREYLYTTYREKYLDNDKEYDEKIWISNIKAEIKKVDKNKQIKMIYDMVHSVMIDIFNKFIGSPVCNEEEYISEFNAIRIYANEQLKKISEYYGTKVYLYKSDFKLEF
ncbi:RING finger protein [Indivirus ILV1]|uniref:RING finger protein n=1 Tax=Indivirus ILV1 TaxID=1977633 RepID=A0A1V0SEH8_9VIRU|nr:RING finger protein [Indivirus ILV1]